jgi:exodeoxyribonuclease VII large subunit
MSSLFDLPFEEDERERRARSSSLRAGPDCLPPGADPPRPAAVPRTPLTVTELTADIRAVLESGFAGVWVEGELSNCRLWNTGHLYFTLKDAGAQLKAVMFRSDVRRLRFKCADGQHVVARGRLSVYDQKGEYQIICESLEPRGLGALQLAFEQLKRTLEAAGLFDPARKRPLPVLPRKIGVVTSMDGAAIRDILSVLDKRYPRAHVVIRPVRVQGEGAAQDVARGLQQIARVDGVDVVIVGRGGGSIEDLWAFNEEVVARAIAQSPVPVISAVGHETDVTIADFVADLRAPTPSAAAECVVARRDEFLARIDRQGERLRAGLDRRLLLLAGRVRALESSRGLARVPASLALRARHIGEIAEQLRRRIGERVHQRARRLGLAERGLERHDPRRRLADAKTRLTALGGRLDAAAARRQARDSARFGALAGRLETLSPLAVLGRGYAVCWNADRTVIIRQADVVRPGDDVRVTLARGELVCEVKDHS